MNCVELKNQVINLDRVNCFYPDKEIICFSFGNTAISVMFENKQEAKIAFDALKRITNCSYIEKPPPKKDSTENVSKQLDTLFT